MYTVIELIYLLIGLSVGFLSAWFISKALNKRSSRPEDEDFRSKYEKVIIENNVLQSRLKDIVESLNEAKRDIDRKEDDLLQLTANFSARNAEYENLEEKLKTQKEDMEGLQKKFTVEFKNLANEILEEKTAKFTELNKNNINQILKPLGEKIKDFEKKVEEVYDKESKERFSLGKEIKSLVELNEQLSKDATNLTNALKGQSKLQGNWGEFILENILEKSGLVKDREYFVQSSYTAADGKRLQPDVVVSYPGERNVVIDSKVSLTAYERYCSLDDEDDRAIALKEHLQSVRNHVQELSSKNYQDIYQLNSLDFVMMFMPVEPSYLLAIEKDHELWSYAYERRILIISPTNLIAALKMIASLWQQEYQNQNAMEIAKKSGDLYDKFVAFTEDMIDIGKRIDSTQSSYQQAMNKLSEGKGNLIKRTEDIRKLGAKTRKLLPKQLMDSIEEEEE
ncbi:MAG: DNA recombination protein RmuC [Marinilabiliales bacterium]|nr:MAG: DNA recombination protein RmuC [Marinilabiliales bacterium]